MLLIGNLLPDNLEESVVDLVPSKSWSIIIIIYLPRHSPSSLCFPTRDLLCPQRGSAVRFLLPLISLLTVLPDG